MITDPVAWITAADHLPGCPLHYTPAMRRWANVAGTACTCGKDAITAAPQVPAAVDAAGYCTTVADILTRWADRFELWDGNRREEAAALRAMAARGRTIAARLIPPDPEPPHAADPARSDHDAPDRVDRDHRDQAAPDKPPDQPSG